jgi:ribosome maturation factor RimP
VRAADFTRFAGREIALRGHVPLAGVGRRIEGLLIGLVEEGGRERIRLQTSEGNEVDIPREDVARAHLLFRWKSGS